MALADVNGRGVAERPREGAPPSGVGSRGRPLTSRPYATLPRPPTLQRRGLASAERRIWRQVPLLDMPPFVP